MDRLVIPTLLGIAALVCFWWYLTRDDDTRNNDSASEPVGLQILALPHNGPNILARQEDDVPRQEDDGPRQGDNGPNILPRPRQEDFIMI